MKMKTLRELRNQAPKHARVGRTTAGAVGRTTAGAVGRTTAGAAVRKRREFDFSDATMEPDAGPTPEAVFDRITGPYGRRFSSFDEET